MSSWRSLARIVVSTRAQYNRKLVVVVVLARNIFLFLNFVRWAVRRVSSKSIQWLSVSSLLNEILSVFTSFYTFVFGHELILVALKSYQDFKEQKLTISCNLMFSVKHIEAFCPQVRNIGPEKPATSLESPWYLCSVGSTGLKESFCCYAYLHSD